jgi:hypothetical protein
LKSADFPTFGRPTMAMRFDTSQLWMSSSQAES